MYIGANNYKEIPHISAEKCKATCASDTKCKSADYNKLIKRCFLSAMTYEEAKKEKFIRDSKDYILFVGCPSGKDSLFL